MNCQLLFSLLLWVTHLIGCGEWLVPLITALESESNLRNNRLTNRLRFLSIYWHPEVHFNRQTQAAQNYSIAANDDSTTGDRFLDVGLVLGREREGKKGDGRKRRAFVWKRFYCLHRYNAASAHVAAVGHFPDEDFYDPGSKTNYCFPTR